MKSFEFTAPIRTERLVIRQLTLSDNDVDDVHVQQSDPDVTTFMLYDPRDRATVVTKLREWTESHVLAETADYVHLAIELADAVPPTAQEHSAPPAEPHRVEFPERRPVVIGTLYFSIKNVEASAAEIGWALHPHFFGQGYAREAAAAMLAVMFDELELHRIVANLDPRNDASVRLCLALGMRHEAHHVEDLWFKGAWADTDVYAILDHEWAKLRKR